MSVCKAYDVAFVRFRVPELATMRTFLGDFGMIDVPTNNDRQIFIRGYGDLPFVHACELGDDPAFLGFGIWLRSIDELEKLATFDNVAIESFDGPGGGHVVRLAGPDGFVVEAVAGQQMAPPVTVPRHTAWNQGGNYPRQREWRRVPRGASHVRRLGHVVLGVSDFRRSEAWYKERFGFVTSDEIRPALRTSPGSCPR